MTPLEKKFKALGIDASLTEIVKLEYAMKKHFIYIDNIDELKHKVTVISDFDKAIRIVRNLIQRLKAFRGNLINQ